MSQKDSHVQEKELFQKFLSSRNLKQSTKRDVIVDVFFEQHEHITAEDLHVLCRKRQSSIGYTTVYRTLKLLCESGLCIEHRFADGIARYEHLYGHPHHDHLICVDCGDYVEVFDQKIEKLQDSIFKAHNFKPKFHKMELYGLCPSCQ